MQKFIYNISNKSAAKSLKGRSLYIQLLLETIAREMLEEVGASIVNVIYIAGGKFYLLLPNTDEVNQKIELYYTKLQEKIWEEHKEHIAVYIGGIAFRMDMKDNKENEDNKAYIQIEGENEHRSVGDLWGLLEQRLGSERQSRLKRQLVEDENFYNQLFQAHGEGGDVKVCAVTGLEVEEKEENLLNKDDVEQGDEEEKVYVSQQVKEQIRLGKSLMNHRYLIGLKSQERDAFQMGVSSYWKFMDKLPANLDNVKTILCTNQPEFLKEIMNAVQNKNQIKDIGLGFRLYGGAEFPQINGKIKTFEELAREDNVSNQQEENQKEKVFTRLGILRMDVDNLGNLFKYGFEKKLSSFSALATLSTELDLFFSGYLNTLRNQNEYRDHVIVIYSGGDDVFAVGRWDKIIAFASQIRKDFRKFVCQREEISLSCGIALVRPKFPISKAADIAGEAEDAAKKYDSQINNQTFKKNAINFLGLSLNWFHEWPFVEDCKEDLVYWIQKGILSKGILMKIFQWYDQYQFYANRQTSQARQPANSQPLRWKWHAAYSFARIAASVENGDKKQEVQQACDELKKLLFCGQYLPLTSKNNAGKPYHHIEFHALVVACRWAELILRNL
ncbi:type III-A CRISPR-associated protein Cas10/Csm1 [Thermoflavifilum aggregans]|uniref:type III-A CRISPR-associated protein Cas10/Csm1 n=1 Tax=Thermoflavifilum aggregans TaxID=454188 RepID=UPI000C236EFD